MRASRNVTSIINFILDNLCPPILRDCYPLMYPIYRMAYGKETGKLLHFKDHYAHLTTDEIADYYACSSKTSLSSRPTDLNRAGIAFILQNIVCNGSVLDVGCGRGWLANHLTEHGFSTTGLDIAPPKQACAKYAFVQGDIEQMPFADASFDTVICAHTLEHVHDFDRALQELLRVTRSTLIVVLPRQREYRYVADLHVRYFPYLYNVQAAFPGENTQITRVGSDWGVLIHKEMSKEICQI